MKKYIYLFKYLTLGLFTVSCSEKQNFYDTCNLKTIDKNDPVAIEFTRRCNEDKELRKHLEANRDPNNWPENVRLKKTFR